MINGSWVYQASAFRLARPVVLQRTDLTTKRSGSVSIELTKAIEATTVAKTSVILALNVLGVAVLISQC